MGVYLGEELLVPKFIIYVQLLDIFIKRSNQKRGFRDLRCGRVMVDEL